MDTLKIKTLFILLVFNVNCICNARLIECSICHKDFEWNEQEPFSTVCANCNKLIKEIQEWRDYCPECKQRIILDFCPKCYSLLNLDKPIETHVESCTNNHKFQDICLGCIEHLLIEKRKCWYKDCDENIERRGCLGYQTFLCSFHNAALKNAVLERKQKCPKCKNRSLLDLCSVCLVEINANHCDNCKWGNKKYSPYVPCLACLEKNKL